MKKTNMCTNEPQPPPERTTRNKQQATRTKQPTTSNSNSNSNHNRNNGQEVVCCCVFVFFGTKVPRVHHPLKRILRGTKLTALRCTIHRCSVHVERVSCAVLPSSPLGGLRRDKEAKTYLVGPRTFFGHLGLNQVPVPRTKKRTCGKKKRVVFK